MRSDGRIGGSGHDLLCLFGLIAALLSSVGPAVAQAPAAASLCGMAADLDRGETEPQYGSARAGPKS